MRWWTVAMALCATSASAQVPDIMTWSGTLTDGAGVALDGTHTFDFEVFNARTAGSSLVAFTQDVDVIAGEVVVDLTFDPSLFDGSDLWLEITVEGDTLSPRVRLSTQSYAFRAGTVSFDDIDGLPAGFADGVDDATGVTAGAGIVISNNVISLAANGVTSAIIANDAVGSTEIAADAVGAAEIASGAVGATEIANNAITNAHFTDACVDTAELANGSVTSAKILDGDVAAADLASNCVTNAKIADGAVDTAELANNAVTAAKIAANAVTATQLADNAVTTTKIANAAVTRAKIQAGGVLVRLVENPQCANVGSLTTGTSCRAAFCGVSGGGNSPRFFRCGSNQCDQNTAATNCGLSANNGTGTVVGVLVP